MSKLITSIYKLPLTTFIDCLVDEDYSGLTIEGNPSNEQTAVVWNDILEQYADALHDDGNKRYVAAVKECQQAKVRYDLANTYIELLNNYYKQGAVIRPWITELNKLIGSNYSFNQENIDAFEKYLNSAFKRNKGNLIAFNLSQARLEELAKVSITTDKKPDRAYFTKVMVNLKGQNQREIPETISTYEFCVLVNNYKEHLDYLESQKQKNGRR